MDLNPDGSGQFSEVVLRPAVVVADASREPELPALHERAHELCFIARSVNFTVRLRTGVLLITGATASGKTDLAIRLARTFDAEIVSADSRQIYRGMPVGTAAPTAAQLASVPHHLIGFLDPAQRYSAARFSADAAACINAIHARGKRAIVAGGTGFYIRALTGGVDLAPQFDERLRERLAREARLHDSGFMYEWLTVRDPSRAATLHPADTYRVLRALEIALARRSPCMREKRHASLVSEGIPFLKVFLDVTPSSSIAVSSAGLTRCSNTACWKKRSGSVRAVAASAVGYPQALGYLHGWCTFEELRMLLVRATRRYAKRQMTWFRTEPDTLALLPTEVEQAAREKLRWV